VAFHATNPILAVSQHFGHDLGSTLVVQVRPSDFTSIATLASMRARYANLV
jgi:hypothetical protein